MRKVRYSHGYKAKNFSETGSKTSANADRKDSRFNVEGAQAIERIFGVYIDPKGLREPQSDYGARSAKPYERTEIENKGAA